MSNIENLEWEEVSCEHVIQDEWIDFRKSKYDFRRKIPTGNAYYGMAIGAERKLVIFIKT